MVDLNDYEKEQTCTYRGETYTARDNGAVFRHKKEGSRTRKYDGVWTFGRPREKDAYMFIASIQVHRIVATAFHGSQPSESHVVDHIDTNRKNNRPENLRWITRLENLLLNEVTARRIEIAYGSIENFLNDPDKPLKGELDPNFDWMRTVTKEEAKESHRRLIKWAESGSIPSGGPLGQWLYRPDPDEYNRKAVVDNLSKSKTHGVVQKNWKTPSEFPQCPAQIYDDALVEYHQNLDTGVIFAFNDYWKSTVVETCVSNDYNELLVLTKSRGGVKEWSLAKVTIKDKQFVHESLGSFFTLEGARKKFTIAQGLKWEGGDTIDDFS